MQHSFYWTHEGIGKEQGIMLWGNALLQLIGRSTSRIEGELSWSFLLQ